MNTTDFEYFRLLDNVLAKGRVKKNRTGIDTIGIFGEQAKFDLQDGFPLLTTKRVFFKGIVHELLWFISGDTNIKYLVDNNVHIWDEWAYARMLKLTPEMKDTFSTLKEFIDHLKWLDKDDAFVKQYGELGEGTYGGMWRNFPIYDTEPMQNVVNEIEWYEGQFPVYTAGVDQMQKVMSKLKTNPDDRRLIVSAWHPYWVDHCALPPCHCLFQFHTEELEEYERLQLWQKKHCTFKLADGSSAVTAGLPSWYMGADTSRIFKEHFDKDGIPSRRLNCQLYQRSCDLFLGVPFNIASYSLLLSMMAHCVDMIPGTFTHTYGDLHIYSNHLEQVKTQRSREPLSLPTLNLNPQIKDLFAFKYEDIQLENYQSHPAIKAEVAV